MLQFFMWLKMFPDAIKRIFSGAGQVVIGVIRYWYFTMAVPAVLAVYYLLQALQNSGIMDKFKAIVLGTLNSISYITTKCFPLINDLSQMAHCIQYSP